MTRLYFAYGSNMNPEQFASRCPASRFIGRATLHGYRFIITVRGYANVVQEPGAVVHGVMAELTPRDERTLDRCEGVAAGIYRREMLRIRADDGGEAVALVYVDNETRIGIPKGGYLERILEGARFHGLSGATIKSLEAWAG